MRHPSKQVQYGELLLKSFHIYLQKKEQAFTFGRDPHWEQTNKQMTNLLKKKTCSDMNKNGKEHFIKDYFNRGIAIGKRDGTQLWIQPRQLGIYGKEAEWEAS